MGRQGEEEQTSGFLIPHHTPGIPNSKSATRSAALSPSKGPQSAIAVSIIIVNWNTRDLLARCLESVISSQTSLARHRDAKLTTHDWSLITDHWLPITDHSSLITEIFVVDNASTDGSAAMVRERFPQVHLIENAENVGFARANNQAIRQSRGRYVLLLNSDTEVQRLALKKLVSALDTHPQAGAAGPRMLNPDGTLQNSYGPLPSVLSEIVGPYLLDVLTKPWGRIGHTFMTQSLGDTNCVKVDRVSFACTLIRRDAFQEVGLLDERFTFYSEDYDWFKRLKGAGWQVLFCPQAQVVHHWGASSRQCRNWALSQLYRSKRLYYAKHYGPVVEQVLRIGLAVRFVVKLILALANHPVRRSSSLAQIKLQRRLIGDMLRSL